MKSFPFNLDGEKKDQALAKLREENAKLKQEVEDLSSIISMLKTGMEKHSNCPSCKAREPQLRPK